MKRLALCLILLPGCTTTQHDAGSDAGSHITLEVDCNEGARVRFGGSRAESEDQTGKTIEVNPSTLKGEL